ncbi:MAG: hypothetical protein KGL95_13385 [Patescibacteria group bacterium]|nr:hypothetical protein [Patescibacteria group bacterium]
MDPKQQLNQLDPKLKEAYERVMGTPVSNSPTQPATQTPPSVPPQTPAPNAAPPPPPPPTQNQSVPSPTQTPAPPPIQPTPISPVGNPHMQPGASLNPFGTQAPQPGSNATPTQPGHAATPAKPGTASHGFVANKRGLHFSPLLLIVGGIFFLLVYTVFWLKFFNIPLPFPIPFLSQ